MMDGHMVGGHNSGTSVARHVKNFFLNRTSGTLPKHGHPNLPGRVRSQDLGHCDQSALQVSWPTSTQHLGQPDLQAAGCLGKPRCYSANGLGCPLTGCLENGCLANGLG